MGKFKRLKWKQRQIGKHKNVVHVYKMHFMLRKIYKLSDFHAENEMAAYSGLVTKLMALQISSRPYFSPWWKLEVCCCIVNYVTLTYNLHKTADENIGL